MTILILAGILLAGVNAEYKPLTPGASSGTALESIQRAINYTVSELFRHDESSGSWDFIADYAPIIPMVKNQFCDLEKTYLLSEECKDDFISITATDSADNKCNNGTCSAFTYMIQNMWPDMVDLTSATRDSEFFELIKYLYVDPFMTWTCGCTQPMMSAWTGCAAGMAGAKIWNFLPMAGMTSGNITMIKTIVTEFPWEALEDVVLRVVGHMCTDVDDDKCYEQFYTSVQEIYKIFVKTSGLDLAQNAKEKTKTDDIPEECLALTGVDTMVDFATTLAFTKEKFCVADCEDYYQEALMGCCLASMVNDKGLEQKMQILAEDAKVLFNDLKLTLEEMYPEQDLDFDDQYMEYMGYAAETLDTMRNPTCDNGVSYAMEGCDEGPGAMNSMTRANCVGLNKKAAKKCKKSNEDAAREDSDCANIENKKQRKKCEKAAAAAGGSGDVSGDCANIENKKQRKNCEKAAGAAGGSGDGPCAGKKGMKLKKCEKKQAGGKGGKGKKEKKGKKGQGNDEEA